ncbi:hypothetical protein BHM03_00061822 [Ensete ventricosum]|nr:hypothetical protein BHM03_00061822 [Ensete ventricosum]
MEDWRHETRQKTGVGGAAPAVHHSGGSLLNKSPSLQLGNSGTSVEKESAKGVRDNAGGRAGGRAGMGVQL